MKAISKRNAIVALLGLGASLALGGLSLASEAPKDETPTKPTIRLTEVPKIEPGPEKTGEITGKVSGLSSFKGYKVVIYSKGGTSWWVQPTAAKPLTDIGDDGEFTADVHGGTEYAALLVKDAYKANGQIESLPAKGGDVVAITKKKP
jgi:hypothetical protein